MVTIKPATPNGAVLFLVIGFVAYWVAALFVPPLILRDIFNNLALGVAVMVSLLWASAAWQALQNADERDHAWRHILSVFMLWFVILLYRFYAIVFNASGRPNWMSESAFPGFFPYSLTLIGILALTATDVESRGVSGRSMWMIVCGVAIGSFVAGIMIALNLSTAF